MRAPYRRDVGCQVVDAPTRRGGLRLEIAPKHVQLDIDGVLNLTVHDQFLTWIDLTPAKRRRFSLRRRQPKKRSVRLEDRHLLVARSHLTEELSLWLEERAGIFRRIVGMEPVILLDAEALSAWRALDRLARALSERLEPYAGQVQKVTEFGRGQHRVLLIDYAEHVDICARPVFRERQRPVFRVFNDGLVRNLKGKGQEGRCVSRYSVTVGGDSIRFDQVDGERAAELHLPWVSTEDRAEIAQRLRTRVDGAGRKERMQTEAEDREGALAAAIGAAELSVSS